MTTASRSPFNAPAVARHDGPETSHRAAQRLTKSHALRTQREIVLAALIRNPGSTAAEIAELTGMKRHDPSRRLPEMRKAGLVTNGRERVCRITGAESLTWLPLQSGQSLLEAQEAGETDDEQLIRWFRENRDRLPAEPFDLRPGERVRGPKKFYAALESDVAAGPTGPSGEFFWRSVTRARWSPLLGDIAALKAIVDRRASESNNTESSTNAA